MDLSDRLRAAAGRNAHRHALWTESDHLTYADLFDRAQALASRIDARIPRDMALGIQADRGTNALVAILAAALSRRPYVPLNPTFPYERLRAIVEAARLGAILCTSETRASATLLIDGMVPGPALLDETGVVLSDGAGQGQSYPDTAYLMFTSGTTGAPKGVRVLECNLTSYLDGIAPITRLSPDDRTSQFFELSFDLSVHDIFVTWVAGAELCVMPRTQAMATVAFAREHRLTSWFSVPSQAAFSDKLGHLEAGALPNLRQVLFCGEALPVAIARRMAQAAPNACVWNLYGPTEATIALTAYECRTLEKLDDMPVVPIGFPIGEQIAQIDASGELLLGGSQVTAGYINAPEQNHDRFIERDGTRFYRSGDLVEASAAHGLVYRGRIDDQVKINGYRVELLEIDAALRSCAGSAEAAAVPWPVSETGHADQIVGFVCMPKATSSEIRRACRELLAPYMAPRRIVILDALPTNASGKTDRRALARMLDEERR